MQSNRTKSTRALARGACRTAAVLARTYAPTVIAVLVVVAVAFVAVDAQTVSEKPIDEVALNWRNWMITKIVPFVGAGFLTWNALETKAGNREGFGKLGRSFLCLVIGLAAAGVVSSAAALVN